MSLTPPNSLTLPEAYARFRSVFLRNETALGDPPTMPPTEFAPRKGAEYPEETERSKQARAPALYWWGEHERRVLAVDAAFKEHLVEGALEFCTWDAEAGMPRRIVPDYWRSIAPAFGGRLSPFEEHSIRQPEDSPLADYNGLTPYVVRAEFNKWFAALSSEQADGKEAPKLQNTIDVIRGMFPPTGIPPRGQPNKATLAAVNSKLKEQGRPEISAETLRRARKQVTQIPQA
jgi:hypothetical protein